MDTIDDLAHLGLTTRVLARIGAVGLDARLSRGAVPEDGRRLAARAAWLTSRRHRAELADGWTRLLERAAGTTTVFDARVPIARTAVLAAEPQIVELMGALRGPGPISLATLARARVLLSDGTGPVYAGGDLSTEVADLVARTGARRLCEPAS